MTGDAFLTEPAGGAGRARQAGAPTPLLDQEFDSGTLYTLRAAVQAHADQAGLSEDRAGEVVLAVHELAANAIAHGAGHGHLRMWDLAGTLSCEVVDNGPADAAAASSRPGPSGAGGPCGAGGPPGPSESADPWPTADGHGLWLVRQVADHLDLRSGARGTRAIVTFGPVATGGSSTQRPRPTTGEQAGVGRLGQDWRSRSLSSVSMSMQSLSWPAGTI